MGTVGGSYSYNVICKVCGFKYKNHETRRRWDGLEPVCRDCWEPRHPLDFYRQRNDTHTLRVLNKDHDVNYTGLPTTLDDSFDWLQDVTSGQPTTEGVTYTPSTDGYIDELRVHMGGEPDDYSRGLLATESQTFRIYMVDGTSLLWSKTVHGFHQGWNSIPVVPNVRVLDGEPYMITKTRYDGSNASYKLVADVGAITAQTYLTYGNPYKDVGDVYPTTLSTWFFPFTPSIRPD